MKKGSRALLECANVVKRFGSLAAVDGMGCGGVGDRDRAARMSRAAAGDSSAGRSGAQAVPDRLP